MQYFASLGAEMKCKKVFFPPLVEQIYCNIALQVTQSDYTPSSFEEAHRVRP